jgi:hypothetical protein
LGLIVDCAEADSVWDQVELIRDVHYSHIKNSIAIHSILSTHKHHDHTAGNRHMIRHPIVGVTLKQIYGGAVDNVPFATQQVTNGSFISLPFVGDNDMGSLIEIECIAVPSHTRGSIVYNLRNVLNTNDDGRQRHQSPVPLVVSHMFAGDAMFSGGCGVAFEADTEFPKDMSTEGKNPHNRFKPGAGLLSIERCFCEMLRRALHDDEAVGHGEKCSMANQMLIYPGHEYTLDLLQRQLDRGHEYSNMNRHDPAAFFEVVSQYFVAGHRRNLPKSTRLLTVPTSMKRELKINPYLRSLKKRGEHVLTAVSLWYKYGYRTSSISISNVRGSQKTFLAMPLSQFDGLEYINSTMSDKSESSEYIWNSDHNDVNKSIFSTVYSADLQSVVDGLKDGKLNAKKAAKKLSRLPDRLEESTITRRPIPDRLPSEKNMYLGLLALAVLGSAPSGITYGDSEKMNLAAPVDNSDHLLISKDLLIRSLRRLGLLPSWQSDPNTRDELTQMIFLLWKEATADLFHQGATNKENQEDIEDSNGDLVELGILKLTLYSLTQKTSCFQKVCMPCGSKPSRRDCDPEGAKRQQMKRSGGELVRHDVFQCPMCCPVLGCPVDEGGDNQSPDRVRPNTSTVKIANSPPRGGNRGDLNGNIELKVVSMPSSPKGRSQHL